ncbi:hypothetical protein KGQ72_00565 [Patescibacteria group bacterium]|nr:hypothetical protein [Patescibacteria group bacterium]
MHKGGTIEEKVRRRVKRNALRNIIVLSAGIGLVVMAPNTARLLKYAEGILGPSPRLKRRVSKKYSEMITAGLLKRVKTTGGSRIILTERGKKLAEDLIHMEEIRPKRPRRWDRKWRIIMFDVWERRRGVRDTLRRALEEFEFVKIQHSVWAYPFPCEKLLIFLRAHLKLGKGVLYIVADEIEYDESLRKHFNLPAD